MIIYSTRKITIKFLMSLFEIADKSQQGNCYLRCHFLYAQNEESKELLFDQEIEKTIGENHKNI